MSSSIAKTAVASAIDLLFPPRCVTCGAPCEPTGDAPLFCAACNSELAICQRPTCIRCALVCSEVDLPRGNCGNCRAANLKFEAARTIGPYEGPLRQAVLQAKHALYEPLAIALGQRLAEAIERQPLPDRPELVAPVPMHWLKRLWRKTDPAATIAQAVAQRLHLQCATGLIICRRILRRQATLTPPERRQNVRGAFRASRRWSVGGKRILLIDDVMTTGATAHEASLALLKAGAAAVYVATVARSSPDV